MTEPRSFRSRTLATAAALALLVAGAPPAGAATITFDDIVAGVTTYGYDGDGDGAYDVVFTSLDPNGFNSVGPGQNMLYIAEPGIEGTSNLDPTLRVDFIVGAVGALEFGFALCTSSEELGAHFVVYDEGGNVLSDTFTLGTYTTLPSGGRSNFPEGLVQASFPGRAAYAEFTFTNSSGNDPSGSGCARFIIDTLTGTFGTSEIIDENPPLCALDPATRPDQRTGTARDERPSEDANGNSVLDPGEDLNGNGKIDTDFGVGLVAVGAGSTNLKVTASFAQGDPTAAFAVDLLDPTADGSGSVLVTDLVGNTCTLPVTLETLCIPEHPDDLCDGVDDDCDGQTDEGYVGLVIECGVGACAATATTACEGGVETEACVPGEPYAPNDTTCDAVDDDCDGDVDDDYLVAAITCGAGVCTAAGQRYCVLGATVDECAPGSPLSETDPTCNGVDDDCDGAVDDDYVPVTTSCGLGVCAATGERVCEGARLFNTCTPGPRAADTDTTCDGADDDCNGVADEDYVPTPTACGTGACAATGAMVCAAGATLDTCTADLPLAPTDTSCDGVDDDCDGGTDEDYAPVVEACGLGACATTGPTSCVAGAVRSSCAPLDAASAEVCDGADNDCDGLTDAADLGLALPLCERQSGVCAGARKPAALCAAGAWQPCGDAVYGAFAFPFYDTDDSGCDARDNDCDGATDEAYPVAATSCGQGACAGTAGERRCSAGAIIDTCDPLGAATAERCNGADDDCDGQTDEVWPLLGVGCDGADADLCASGRWVCAASGSGAVCDEPAGGGAVEACDGADNDCDGATDEGCDDDGDGFCDAALACVAGPGLTLAVCPGGCGDCDDSPGGFGVRPGAFDLCDGVDNDCDGAADLGCDDDGDGYCDDAVGCDDNATAPSCPSGCGDCADGDGARHPGAAEACDGIDNDCDGATDDGFGVGASCTVGVGACVAEGQHVCASSGQGTVCDAPVLTGEAERCDGIDDSCDGETDEGFGLGEACAVGVGACARQGERVCLADGSAGCSASTGEPAPERCDGVDNDCDGAVDEAPDASGESVCASLDTRITSGPEPITASHDAHFAFDAPLTPDYDRFACSLDGAPWEACDGGAFEATDLPTGAHTFLVRVIGPDGTADPTPAVAAWTIDPTLPDTLLLAHPDDPAQRSDAAFVFGATVNMVDTFYCVLDPPTLPPAPDAFTDCGDARTFSGLADGPHTLVVYVVAASGAVDPSPLVFGWTIDTSAPDTVLTASPPDRTASAAAAFAFIDPTDAATATFRCRLDGADWAPCDGGAASYGGLAAGLHAFEVAAVDALGHVDPTPARATWVVDDVPPDTFIPLRPADPAQSTSAAFGLAADEDGVHFLCALDPPAAPAPEDFVPCEPLFTVDDLAEGAHALYAVAIDAVGNVDPTPAVHAWVIDTRFPETALLATPPSLAGLGEGAAFAFHDPTDPSAARFDCRLDAGAFAPCDGGSASYAGGALDAGPHSFEVRSCRADGACDPTPAAYAWTVTESPCPRDREAPALSCPPAVTLSCVDGAGALDAAGFAATATDACGPVTVGAADAAASYPLGETAVLFSARDGNGNLATCLSAVVVRDAAPPALTCPADVALTTAPGTCAAAWEVPAATATDACLGAEGLTVVHDAPPVFGPGETLVTHRAFDAAGNEGSCAMRVTVADDEPAALVCPATLAVEAPADRCGWSGALTATATDNCAVDVTVLEQDSTLPVGTSPVTFTTTDAGGLASSCTTAVTVADVTAPAVSCGAAVGALPAAARAEATDACGAEVALVDLACAAVAADGTATALPSEACPVVIAGDTLTVTARLAEGALRVRYAAEAVDAAGNRGAVDCELLFDPDADQDGWVDEADNCPDVPNVGQADIDEDGVGDACDGCPSLSTVDQSDGDGDGVGDACDACPAVADAAQADTDGDGYGDACDVCPGVADKAQADGDGDGVGDVCQDTDADTVLDTADNCPEVPNLGQEDFDEDGWGDACDPSPHDGLSAEGGGGCAGGAGGGAAWAVLLAGALGAVARRRMRRATAGGRR